MVQDPQPLQQLVWVNSPPTPAAATGLWPRKTGEDASNHTYFFAEPRVGYRMANAEGHGETKQ